MAKTLIEPTNGGLVTARPAILLTSGELTEANGIYRPFSQGLWNVPANATYASGLSGVTGLRYAGFDYRFIAKCTLTNASTSVVATGSNTFGGISSGALVRGTGIPANTTVASVTNTTTIVLSNAATITDTSDLTIEADHRVVVQDGTAYKTAIASNTTGTFANVTTGVAAGTTLDSVAYNNQHVLLNGTNPNLVLLASNVVRVHGLKPVTTAPAAATSAGTWTGDEGAGFYSYWTTEYDQVNDIESDFQGLKPQVVNISTTSIKATLTRPAQVNPSATHWRLYRSPKMDGANVTTTANESIFPSGDRVGQAPIDQLTIDDGGTVSSTSALAAGAVNLSSAEWVNPSNATGAANSAFAVYTGTGGPLGYPAPAALELGNFGFTPSGMTAPIAGIQLVITAKKTNNGRLYVSLKKYNDLKTTADGLQSAQYEVPVTASSVAYTLGGTTNTWARDWSPTDFANGNFVVVLRAQGQSTDTVSVDSVTASVSYGTAYNDGATIPFPAIVTTYAGLTTAAGRNGPPPQASTGDMFQDSLVTNDVTQGNVVRYSFPGTLDYFPTQYFINFNTQEQDIVRCVRAVGNALMVGMNGRIWRVTYLPREQDAEFDRGRAVELLDSERGIVGPLAATRYTSPEGQQTLCFFSGTSLNTTDGYRINPATNDINFVDLIEPAYLGQTQLVNNPDLFEIVMTYVPRGTSTQNGVLHFSYHGTHIKQDGTMKASAGSLGTVRAAQAGVLRSGTRVLYLTDGTNVLRANQTPTSTVAVVYTTRQITAVGLGAAQKMTNVETHYTQYGYSAASGGTLSHTMRGHRRNKAAAAVDADYTRVDTAITHALPAYPTGTASSPRDAHYLASPLNFGDTVVSDRVQLNSTAGCHYSVDFSMYEFEPLEDEFS